jgi:hypothetical protein
MIEQDLTADLIEAKASLAKAQAELDNLRRQVTEDEERHDRKVRHKISILRLIFTGITALMGFLGILVVIDWSIPGAADADGIGAAFFQTSKDILLVLSGILGSAMANVFDGRSGHARSTDRQDGEPQA